MDDGVVDRLRVLGSRRTSSCTGSAAEWQADPDLRTIILASQPEEVAR